MRKLLIVLFISICSHVNAQQKPVTIKWDEWGIPANTNEELMYAQGWAVGDRLIYFSEKKLRNAHFYPVDVEKHKVRTEVLKNGKFTQQ